MANVRQISVFMDNKPGQLSGVMEIIKESGINVRALSLADTKDFGILRIVAITIPDSPGQLSRVLEILGKDNVNLEYLYAFTGASDRAVSFVLRVNDNDAAAASLTKGGIIQLTENDIADM